MAWFRRALSYPFFLLQIFCGVVIVQGLRGMGRLFHSLSVGATTHIFWPIVAAKRIVAGMPRWQPVDVVIGKMPRTDDEKARAVAAGLKLHKCACGRVGCVGEIWLPADAQVFQVRPPP